jgi:hypothetical protein
MSGRAYQWLISGLSVGEFISTQFAAHFSGRQAWKGNRGGSDGTGSRGTVEPQCVLGSWALAIDFSVQSSAPYAPSGQTRQIAQPIQDIPSIPPIQTVQTIQTIQTLQTHTLSFSHTTISIALQAIRVCADRDTVGVTPRIPPYVRYSPDLPLNPRLILNPC